MTKFKRISSAVIVCTMLCAMTGCGADTPRDPAVIPDRTVSQTAATSAVKPAETQSASAGTSTTASAATSETTAKATAKTTTVRTTTTAKVTTTAKTNNDNLIRPAVKNAIDSYESFMDEYIAFMKKYNSASFEELIGMMASYYTMLERYNKAVEDFEKLEDDELTAAELQYYNKVNLRVSDKLLKAAITL